MKKVIIALFVALIGQNIQAQDIKSICGDDMVWYGLDFSQAKFVGEFTNIGDTPNGSGNELKNKHIPSWNTLILNEPNKFTVRKSFRKSNVYNDLSIVNDRNSKVNADKITSYNTYKFENDVITVNSIISEYKGGDKTEGLGVVFIVESFDKMANMATIHVTFFDIASKKVLLSEKIVEKPSAGIGVRNYWASALAKIFKEIDANKISQWQSKCK